MFAIHVSTIRVSSLFAEKCWIGWPPSEPAAKSSIGSFLYLWWQRDDCLQLLVKSIGFDLSVHIKQVSRCLFSCPWLDNYIPHIHNQHPYKCQSNCFILQFLCDPLCGLMRRPPWSIFTGDLELVLQWLPCQALVGTGLGLDLVGPVSAYCAWLRDSKFELQLL